MNMFYGHISRTTCSLAWDAGRNLSIARAVAVLIGGATNDSLDYVITQLLNHRRCPRWPHQWLRQRRKPAAQATALHGQHRIGQYTPQHWQMTTSIGSGDSVGGSWRRPGHLKVCMCMDVCIYPMHACTQLPRQSACMRACVRACMRACVRACVRACANERECRFDLS